MKKFFLTLMFVFSFLCIGLSNVKAGTPVSSVGSRTVSEKIAAAAIISTKINAIKSKCKAANYYCTEELAALIHLNDSWMQFCNIWNNNAGCAFLSQLLLNAADNWENCVFGGGNIARNVDRTMDWKKRPRNSV